MSTPDNVQQSITNAYTSTGRRRSRRHFLSVAGGFGILSLLAACTRAPTTLATDSVHAQSAPPISIRPPILNATLSKPAAVTSPSAAAPSTPHRLELPSINVDTSVVELGWHVASNSEDQIFSEWDVAEYAAGWHKNSALPSETGNVVLSGHNNILGAVFRRLDQIKKGDEAILWSGGHPYTYRVEQVMIVPEKYATPEQRAENAKWISEFSDQRLTLVSCWPRNNNTHRIIVVARPETKLQASSGQ